jgi:short-subunit dehydrogenase
MEKFVFAGGTAVVTGAASGIGAALAEALAARGSDLVLLDRDADRLREVTAALHRGHPDRTVTSHVVDLADGDATVRFAEAVRAEHPRLRLLVNNAGVALGGRFDQVTLAEYEWVIDVNFRSMVRLTHTLLPALRAEPGSHLVNVSSLFGLVAPAGQSAYAASKFAIRGFTEVLRRELAGEVGVTTVHPGGIRTRIAESARLGSGVSAAEYAAAREMWVKVLRIEPAAAAAAIMDGIERRRGRVLIGWSAKAPDLLARLLPASHGKVYGAGQGLLKLMVDRKLRAQGIEPPAPQPVRPTGPTGPTGPVSRGRRRPRSGRSRPPPAGPACPGRSAARSRSGRRAARPARTAARPGSTRRRPGPPPAPAGSRRCCGPGCRSGAGRPGGRSGRP